MTQPTNRRFVMEPRLDAEVATINTELNLKAPKASPALTGTPTSTTAAVDTSTTQIATTAFVTNQAAAATSPMDGTAAVGTSKRYARQDHVHPTDTTRAPLASPTFTGTVTTPLTAGVVKSSAGGVLSSGALVAGDIPNIAESQVTNLTNDLGNRLSMIPWVSGGFYKPIGVSSTTAGISLGGTYVMFAPIIVPNTVTINQISTVLTSTVAGSIRLGIFNDNNGLPGTVLLDAGTVSYPIASLTTYSITVSQVVQPGRYWLAVYNISGTATAFGYANGNTTVSTWNNFMPGGSTVNFLNGANIIYMQTSNPSTGFTSTIGTPSYNNFGWTAFVKVA